MTEDETNTAERRSAFFRVAMAAAGGFLAPAILIRALMAMWGFPTEHADLGFLIFITSLLGGVSAAAAGVFWASFVEGME